MSNENTKATETPDSAASALSAGLERLTHEDLRKWGAALDREMPKGLGERLLCFADDWRASIEAECEACAKVCADHPGHIPNNRWNASSALGSCEQLIRMRSNATVKGAA